MTLCLDIGNSTVFMGLIDAGTVLKSCRVSVVSSAFIDAIAEFMQSEHADAAAVSSVVPAKTDAVAEAVRRFTNLNPLRVKGELQPNFPIAFEKAETLGADRIADAAGAIRDYPLPVIIVDAGTATVFSVISDKGVFLGGAICPGLATSFRALTEKAAQLKNYVLKAPEKIIGANTADCINSGIVAGHASLIDGMVQRIEEETKTRYTLVLTGGMAPTVAPFCRCAFREDNTLILRGIYYLAESH